MKIFSSQSKIPDLVTSCYYFVETIANIRYGRCIAFRSALYVCVLKFPEFLCLLFETVTDNQ